MRHILSISLCCIGYHGLYCEEEYNECLSAPCQNYATCRDLINAYECICAPQFTGAFHSRSVPAVNVKLVHNVTLS